MFFKNYLDVLTEPLFQHLLYHRLLFVLIFVVYITISRKISNTTIIVWSWFISVVPPQTSWCLQISINILYLIIHRHYHINSLRVIYLCIIYFSYAISKRSAIFKYYFFISIIYCSTCSCGVWNWYSNFNKYVWL